MQKILIVEDDEPIRFGLKYYLEQENFDVFQAGDAKTALEKFEKTNAINISDIIILKILSKNSLIITLTMVKKIKFKNIFIFFILSFSTIFNIL